VGSRVVLFSLGGLEGKLVVMIKTPFFSRKEKGQSAAVFAVVVTALVLFVVGIMDYMITTSRTMEAVAIADLSAHAGTQELLVLPNGVIEISPQGPGVAASYFSMQAKSYMQFVSANCGNIQSKPACEVTVRVRTAGFLIPAHWITVRAVGYMAYGSTRGGQ
jgi:hypothetical protein